MNIFDYLTPEEHNELDNADNKIRQQHEQAKNTLTTLHNLHIEHLGGYIPTQAWGTLHNNTLTFHFRFRHDTATLTLTTNQTGRETEHIIGKATQNNIHGDNLSGVLTTEEEIVKIFTNLLNQLDTHTASQISTRTLNQTSTPLTDEEILAIYPETRKDYIQQTLNSGELLRDINNKVPSSIILPAYNEPFVAMEVTQKLRQEHKAFTDDQIIQDLNKHKAWGPVEKMTHTLIRDF